MKKRKPLHDSLFLAYISSLMLSACSTPRINARSPAIRNASETKYRHFVSLGMRKIKIGQSCALFNAALSSGNFFEDLTKVDQDSTAHFSKSGSAVTTFPDELFVGVTGIPVKCSISPSEGIPIGVNEKLRNALTFKAFWRSGETLQPVAALAVATVEPQWRELGADWAYELSFIATNIPLTSTLVIQMWTKNGEQLAQFDGHL